MIIEVRGHTCWSRCETQGTGMSPTNIIQSWLWFKKSYMKRGEQGAMKTEARNSIRKGDTPAEKWVGFWGQECPQLMYVSTEGEVVTK